MLIGERIRAARKERKLTLKALAQKIGLSATYLSDIEHLRKNPSFKKIFLIAEGLDIPVSQLINLPEEETPATLFMKMLSNDEQGQKLISLLIDFADWPEADQQELLAYLRAKAVIRGNSILSSGMDIT